MRSRILLFGKNGQLGHELAPLLDQLGELTALSRNELDLCDLDNVRTVIRQVKPHLLVNAAAYTAVDDAERESENARIVNSDAVAVMADEMRDLDGAIVHYSTDYVFDGSKPSPYSESDQTNPINVYGDTKRSGEEALLASGVDSLIFRTGWVYGTRGKNFLLTILRLATSNRELRVVDDQRGAPTWSRAIAAASFSVLSWCRSDGGRVYTFPGEGGIGRGGIYHLTASGTTTWHGFALEILDECRRQSQSVCIQKLLEGRPIIAERVAGVTSGEVGRPARRPSNSTLDNSKIQHTFAIYMPDWKRQLKEALQNTVDGRMLSYQITPPEQL